MKPDWDKVMKKFRNHEHVLVADVDCTLSVSKALCDRMGVKGYPTIKYGDPEDLQDYKGERTAKALYKFAKESLGPQCGPTNMDLCSKGQADKVNKYMAMSEEELDEAIAEKVSMEEEADELLKSMQGRIDHERKLANENHEAYKKEVKASGYGLMKSVLASRKAASGSDGWFR